MTIKKIKHYVAKYNLPEMKAGEVINGDWCHKFPEILAPVFEQPKIPFSIVEYIISNYTSCKDYKAIYDLLNSFRDV